MKTILLAALTSTMMNNIVKLEKHVGANSEEKQYVSFYGSLADTSDFAVTKIGSIHAGTITTANTIIPLTADQAQTIFEALQKEWDTQHR